MLNKILIIFCYFIIILCAYEIPRPNIFVYPNQGFRVSIPDEPGITSFTFHGQFNNEFDGNEPGDFFEKVTTKQNNQWIYENMNVKFKINATLHYWLYVEHDDFGYRIDDQTYQFTGTNDNQQQTASTIVSPSVGSGCEPSITTMNGKPTCKGYQIFNEDFNNDLTQWQNVVEIPTDKEDNEFVSYQNRPETCILSDGKFIIAPKLLSTFPGNNIESVEFNELKLPSCTGKSEERCVRRTASTRILPPVVSCKIRTKHKFNFKYGKIEIRAKFPKGDWMFPELYLEPNYENLNENGYPYGQMRIGFIRANEVLLTTNNTNISGKRLYGGIVLTPGELHREDFYKSIYDPEHFGNDYHNYTLIWTKDLITLKVDGEDYGIIENKFIQYVRKFNIHTTWSNENSVTPFNREFFIALGIGVGGISDFPDNCNTGNKGISKPWSNRDPRNEIRFWLERNNWYDTWSPANAQLEIDYVKVWAI